MTSEPHVLATVVWRRGPSSGKQGSKAVIDAAGNVSGWLGGACAEPAVVREALRALADGQPRLMFLGPPEELDGHAREGVLTVPIACQSEGAMEVFVEPVLPKPHLVVVGRSPAVQTLVSMASALGWEAAATDSDDLSGASERSYVVVATQGHHDEPALKAALALRPAYVGLVASRRRADAVLDFLRASGTDEEDLARVRAPAGLDLGRVSHEEIAVAILAELVQLRAAGELGTGAPVAAPVEEAVDPICGMTVAVADARFTAEHEGRTWYFCSAGCRERFVAEHART